MNFRSTILLATLVLTLGSYIYWVENDSDTATGTSGRLLDFLPSEITEIDIHHSGQNLGLRKDQSEWRLEGNRQARADQRVVEQALRTLADARVQRILGKPEDLPENLSTYGFEPATMELRLRRQDGPLPTLFLGNDTPLGARTYARLANSGEILLTSSRVRSSLPHAPQDWRDKNVLSIEPSDVESFTITGEGRTPLSVKRSGAQWEILEPTPGRASEAAVNHTLETLRNLSAVDFLADEDTQNPNRHGLEPARFEIAVVTRSTSSPVTLRIGDPVDGNEDALIAAQVSGESEIYLLAGQLPSRLDKTARDLLDKTLVSVNREQVNEVQLRTAKGEHIGLRRQGTQWRLIDEAGGETAPRVAQRLVDDIFELEGYDIVTPQGPLSAYGLDRPDIRVELFGQRGNLLGQVLLRHGTNGGLATAGDSAPVYTITQESLRRLDISRDAMTRQYVPPFAAHTPEEGS